MITMITWTSGLETKTETLAIRYRDRDRDLDEMNSSALESRDHGLEITTLDVVYEDYHHDTSSSSSSSSLFQAARPVSQYIHKDTEHREIL